MPRGVYPRKRRGQRRTSIQTQQAATKRAVTAFGRAMTTAANAMLDAARINANGGSNLARRIVAALAPTL